METQGGQTMKHRIIIIPPNSYDTIKTLSYNSQKEVKDWMKHHKNNPTIANCQIIIEERKIKWN